MTLLLKQLFTFLKLLNSETGTNQIAAGLCAGMVMGFSPALSLQTLLIFLVIFFFRIQMGAAFVAAFFFKFIAFMLDPIFHEVGAAVLSQQSLEPFFTVLYNMPIVPFTRFYNSVVMGSGLVALILCLPMFFVFRVLIQRYRSAVVEKFKNSKFFKALKATSFYKWYYTYDKLYG